MKYINLTGRIYKDGVPGIEIRTPTPPIAKMVSGYFNPVNNGARNMDYVCRSLLDIATKLHQRIIKEHGEDAPRRVLLSSSNHIAYQSVKKFFNDQGWEVKDVNEK